MCGRPRSSLSLTTSSCPTPLDSEPQSSGLVHSIKGEHTSHTKALSSQSTVLRRPCDRLFTRLLKMKVRSLDRPGLTFPAQPSRRSPVGHSPSSLTSPPLPSPFLPSKETELGFAVSEHAVAALAEMIFHQARKPLPPCPTRRRASSQPSSQPVQLTAILLSCPPPRP